MNLNLSDNFTLENMMCTKNDLLPHEHVVEERKNTYKEYLVSLKPYIILPNIIICNTTHVIIDGHHRYSALIELGFREIPVTSINYMDENVVTDLCSKPIEKSKVISSAINGNLLPPKSSFHHIIDKNCKPQPLILLSPLSKLDWNS